MALGSQAAPIEHGGHIRRARRTAAITRSAVGLLGIAALIGTPGLSDHPWLAGLGFAIVLGSSVVQFFATGERLLGLEESVSGLAALLIVGLGPEHVGLLPLLWLVAIASGVLARGGRVHWLGRALVLAAIMLPVVRFGGLSVEYAALCVGTVGLLLTSGRLTSELNALLREARLHADSAEALLLAGDIAQRMAAREATITDGPTLSYELSAEELEAARVALARLIGGEGLSMAVQAIVDVETGAVHAYEALARFGEPAVGNSPLSWFALAERVGARAELERACLAGALDLFHHRPAGTRLSVNLSAPVLMEPATLELLDGAGERLDGLIIEITEETLVASHDELARAVAPLRARGAELAVDDMGAGYAGLRQITTVLPSYLKLDRALISGIDSDPERSALVGALAGYARQVGSHLVAEGIETPAELERLRELGVPLLQGFHLSLPGRPWPDVNAEASTGFSDDGPVTEGWPVLEQAPNAAPRETRPLAATLS